MCRRRECAIPSRSQELGLSYGTLWRILYLELYLYPYKVQLTLVHAQRRRYVEWVLEQQVVDDNFSNKIYFSHEAHFTLGGYVNRQN